MTQSTNSTVVPINNNPLASFGRKPKLELHLPSEAQWYPAGSINLNADNTVSVRSMTGADDLKFKAGDASMGGSNVLALIASCVPNILQPQQIPSIDLDAILLSIRWASYGQFMKQTISVPNTNLTREITVDLATVLGSLPTASEAWDSDLIIKNQESQITVQTQPLSLGILFEKTQNIQQQRQQLIGQADQLDAASNNVAFAGAINNLTDLAVELIASSVKQITLADGTKITDSSVILQSIENLDVNYFNAIRDHITAQRNNFLLKSVIQTSTVEEQAAGAPTSWQADLTFAGSNFFENTKQQQ